MPRSPSWTSGSYEPWRASFWADVLQVINNPISVPSGELTVCYGKSPFFMGKSTISMAIFHCYVSSPEGKPTKHGEFLSTDKHGNIGGWLTTLGLPHCWSWWFALGVWGHSTTARPFPGRRSKLRPRHHRRQASEAPWNPSGMAWWRLAVAAKLEA